MRNITEIIVHCTATPRGREVSVDEIDRWHRQRGFRCIGYHYIVALDGKVSIGRPEDQIGAHCLGHNARSIGVVYVGGVEPDCSTPTDTRTAAQIESLRHLLKNLLLRYPRATLHGHCEFAAKACPSFDVRKEYASLLSSGEDG